MADCDERLERLISRRLDGEITDTEQHELNKMLIRSPEARRLFETCERQDRVIGAVLRNDLADAGHRFRATETAVRARRGGRGWRRSAVPAVAAAAALVIGAAAMFDSLVGSGRTDHASPGNRVVSPTIPSASVIDAMPAADESMCIPHERRRMTNHEVFGVMGEDGETIYLLDLGHTRTAFVPKGEEL